MKTVLGNQRDVGVPGQPYQGKVIFRSFPSRKNTQKELKIQGLDVCVGRGHCTKIKPILCIYPCSFHLETFLEEADLV